MRSGRHDAALGDLGRRLAERGFLTMKDVRTAAVKWSHNQVECEHLTRRLAAEFDGVLTRHQPQNSPAMHHDPEMPAPSRQ